jgi:hypothetical protein
VPAQGQGALPTATLPHLTALTDRINGGPAEKGIGRRFTPEDMTAEAGGHVLGL